jgi:hypothetical protein
MNYFYDRENYFIGSAFPSGQRGLENVTQWRRISTSSSAQKRRTTIKQTGPLRNKSESTGDCMVKKVSFERIPIGGRAD